MSEQQLQRLFNKLRKHTYYYGDIELLRYFIFELDRVQEDLRRIDYEMRYINSVDNLEKDWKEFKKFE